MHVYGMHAYMVLELPDSRGREQGGAVVVSFIQIQVFTKTKLIIKIRPVSETCLMAVVLLLLLECSNGFN